MDSCWQDDEDLCDIRSDASLLRLLATEGGLVARLPADMLGPAPLPAWLHWTLGTLYSITGELNSQVSCVLYVCIVLLYCLSCSYLISKLEAVIFDVIRFEA